MTYYIAFLNFDPVIKNLYLMLKEKNKLAIFLEFLELPSWHVVPIWLAPAEEGRLGL